MARVASGGKKLKKDREMNHEMRNKNRPEGHRATAKQTIELQSFGDETRCKKGRPSSRKGRKS